MVIFKCKRYLNIVMDYKKLVDVYLELEKTSKRLEKIEIVSGLLQRCGSDELVNVVCLLQGRVFPLYDERKIGMSSRLVLKVISHVSGVFVSEVEKMWKNIGDLGSVAERLLMKGRQMALAHKKLDVRNVFDNIRKLTEMQGAGAVNRKIGLVAELLNNATPEEARFIVRTVLGELRVGVADGVLRDAIARAYGIDARDVEKSFDILVDYADVAQRAREGKFGTLCLGVGKPFRVMLSIKVDTIEEAFKAVGKPALLEFKLDGFRVQIHKDSKEIKLFTRRLENVTQQFKEVLPLIEKYVKARECILDSEFVGYDSKTGRYLPFQHISQRIKRKYDIDTIAKKIPVEVNVFDIVHYNGKDLMDVPQNERRSILEKIIKEHGKKIVLTKKLVAEDEKKAMLFFKEALRLGHEGLMIKNLRGIYQPGKRVEGWVKLKNIREPLDLVIVKAEWGEGKRVQWLTSYTVACKDGDGFIEVGKVSTGVKEKYEGLTYKEMTGLLKRYIISEKGKEVVLKPAVVIEVAYEEIQKSPTYSSGFALRFPRVLRNRTDEKSINDINTLKDIGRFYRQQKK